MFHENDLIQLSRRGISIEEVNRQIELFKKGVPFVKLIKPATIGDGIIQLDESKIDKFIRIYDQFAERHKVVKFVPASGAATRMFKDIYSFLESDDLSKYSTVRQVIDRINEFAFYDDLITIYNGNDPRQMVYYIVSKEGLNYGSMPKAFIKFHKYENYSRTSLEEHLVEGALYAKSLHNNVYIHFTLSPEHVETYFQLIEKIINYYQQTFNVRYKLEYSVQQPSTDTIAVDENNNPFRDKDGSLLFRPAGHGALIYNLNEIDADVIFIKNIDNVVPDKLKTDTIKYKKALAGLLVYLQEKIFEYQNQIENNIFNENTIAEIRSFYKECFHVNIENDDINQIRNLLFRPIRVCGMVKNQGEPGGGPFWVLEKNNKISLQIVESSQINMNDNEQLAIFKNSTHFNPVDLVCSIKNYKGDRYNLHNYVDPDTSFISSKTKDGKAIKALELPGLWNGAMAYWNTIFVEVPITTFNPVKTINDLLRSQHLNN